MSCLLTFPCHSIWAGSNQLAGSIPSELGELASLIYLWLGTWIGLSWLHECHACSHFLVILWTGSNQLAGSIPSELGELTSLTGIGLGMWIVSSCWHECHACSHFLSILFHQFLIKSRVSFRANSENWRHWLSCILVRAMVCLVGMNVMLAHISLLCYSASSVYNQLSGSIPSELGALTSLTLLWLGTWIGLSCSYECHACSHFRAILFHQFLINWRVPFRANSENWRRWLNCGSVRGLV
jgi:hypothetical protein